MKQIYFKLIILFIIGIIPVAFFNYRVDPYGIFNYLNVDLWYEPGCEPNQHYAKMRHLINDKHSWDSYLFGSSRAGKINPTLIPGGSYYNMNYSEGLPGEHLEDIEVLLENRIPIKNVIIGLDNFSYTMRPEDHSDQIMRHQYDAIALKRIVFLIKYLCSAPQLNIIKNTGHAPSESSINFNIYGNGMQKLDKIDSKIEENIDHHFKSERFIKANNIPFDKVSEDKYMKIMDDTIKDIIAIIELSKKYHINLYFFINPTHNKFYLQGNPYHFLKFKEKLAQITNYWDFSGFNTVTTNNYYYYETSHYRPIAGDLIICRMFNCSNLKVPDDFGVFVNKENINTHIKKQKDELKALSIL
jgi:hypothetical protein